MRGSRRAVARAPRRRADPPVPRIIAVVDWKSTQHYTGRNPPWIKLQSSYLDDLRVQSVSSCDFGVFCKISLIASRCDNRIVFDPRLFRRRYGVSPISIRNLERAGLITITDSDDVQAPDQSPVGDRSSADRSAIGDRSESDRVPIGTQSNTDRASIDDQQELPAGSNQPDSSKSASTPLADREHDACSEAEAEKKDQSRERASKQKPQKPARPPEIDGDGDADEEQQIRTELKRLGVVIHKCDTHPKRWIAEGITLDRLTAAVRFIRQYRAKPEPQRIFAAYLDEVVHDETAVDPIQAILANRPPPDPEHERRMREQDEALARAASETIPPASQHNGADTMQHVNSSTNVQRAIVEASPNPRRSLREVHAPKLPDRLTLTLDEIDHRVRKLKGFDAPTIAKNLAQYGVTIEQVRESQARISNGAAHE